MVPYSCMTLRTHGNTLPREIDVVNSMDVVVEITEVLAYFLKQFASLLVSWERSRFVPNWLVKISHLVDHVYVLQQHILISFLSGSLV